jgi:hypothetical protein
MSRALRCLVLRAVPVRTAPNHRSARCLPVCAVTRPPYHGAVHPLAPKQANPLYLRPPRSPLARARHTSVPGSTADPPWPPPLDTSVCLSPKPPHHPGASSSPYRSSPLTLSRRRGSNLPEQGVPQLATTVASARPCRRHHRPNLRSKSSLGTPLVALRPRPAGPGRRFAGIWQDRRRPVPEGYIARYQVFLRA